MATWHTNNLTGNDTTGDGSAALPYKSIAKAYSVAAAGDTVKVAGSTLSNVPGITLSQTTPGSSTFVASVDPTGLLAVGDCISLTEPGFGADGVDKFFARIAGITGNNIVLTISGMRTGVNYAVRKFNQIHYTTSTTGVTFETGATQPANIQLLGGWNSDFTVQDGWTVAGYLPPSGSATTVSGTFVAMGPTTGDGTYRERFAVFSMATAFNGSTRQEYWGDMIACRVNNICGGTPRTLPGSTVKWYVVSSNTQSGANTFLNSDGTYGMILEEIWINKAPSGSNPNISNTGFRANKVYNLLNSGVNNTTGTGLLPSTVGCSVGDVYVCANVDSSIRVFTGNRQFTWEGGLYFTASDVVYLYPGTSTGLLEWDNPTQNVDNFYWWYSLNSAIWWEAGTNIYVKDIQGDKLIARNSYSMTDSTEYVTGTNSLKLLRMQRGGGQFAYTPVAQFRVNPSTTSISITITAKVDGTPGVSDQFRIYPSGIDYNWLFNNGGNILENALQSTNSVTNTWSTFTFTITNANTIQLLKNQLNVLTWRNTLVAGQRYLWIDDIVITQS